MSLFKSAFMTTGSRWACMFFNDNTFEFKQMPVKDSSLLVKNGADIEKAWPVLNKVMVPFAGLGSIKRGRVLVACENDIIFDVFCRLTDAEKPERGPGLVKEWIKKKAETVRYRHQAKPKSSTLVNRIVLFLGSGMILMAIALLIAALKGA